LESVNGNNTVSGHRLYLGRPVQRLGQSAFIGYLPAGTIVGPLTFNRDAVSSVAELGVALLLFSIGLKFSFQRLRRLGIKVLLLGGMQIGLTLAVFALLFSGDGSWQQAVTMGALIACSSTTIVLRILVDRAQIDSVHGCYAFGFLAARHCRGTRHPVGHHHRQRLVAGHAATG
jgi:CPA2 family monovalent cation:H+ antiporter-2